MVTQQGILGSQNIVILRVASIRRFIFEGAVKVTGLQNFSKTHRRDLNYYRYYCKLKQLDTTNCDLL